MSKGVRDHEGVVASFRRAIELSPQGSWRVSWHCPRDLLGCCRSDVWSAGQRLLTLSSASGAGPLSFISCPWQQTRRPR